MTERARRIARALAEELARSSSDGETLEFKDDNKIYTVRVTVQRANWTELRESKGAQISAGPSGSACGCCNGSGRASV